MICFNSSVSTPQEDSLVWRLHTLTWAAKNALHIEGDFVECGVLKGFSSQVIFKYLDFKNVPKKAYLYDTFQGIFPEETSTQKEREKWDYSRFDSETLYSEVCETFSIYPNVEIIRGVVPASFSISVPEKISFLHIDMNSTKAEIFALEALFEKVSPGGYILLDDFGWDISQNQAIAELEFMRDRGHSILELPTGQGLIIKHT